MAKRLKNKEQLTRLYAEGMESYSCSDYFDYVLQCWGMSSDPIHTLTVDVQEMTTETRKEFLLWLIDAEANRRAIVTTINAM